MVRHRRSSGHSGTWLRWMHKRGGERVSEDATPHWVGWYIEEGYVIHVMEDDRVLDLREMLTWIMNPGSLPNSTQAYNIH